MEKRAKEKTEASKVEVVEEKKEVVFSLQIDNDISHLMKEIEDLEEKKKNVSINELKIELNDLEKSISPIYEKIEKLKKENCYLKSAVKKKNARVEKNPHLQFKRIYKTAKEQITQMRQEINETNERLNKLKQDHQTMLAKYGSYDKFCEFYSTKMLHFKTLERN